MFKLAIPNFSSRCLSAIIEVKAQGSDDILASKTFQENVILMAICGCGMAFFSCLRIWCTAKAEVRVIARIQRILFASILKKDIEYFDVNGTGALTSRLTSDATLLGSILTSNVNMSMQSTINLLGSTIYLFFLNFTLAGVYMCILVIFFVVTQIFGRYSRTMQKAIQDVKSEANQVAEQSISLIRLVRAFSAEFWEKALYDGKNQTSVVADLKLKMLWTIYVPVVSFVQVGLTLCVLLLGGRLVSKNEMSAANLTAFLFYSQTVQDAMQTLTDNLLNLLAGLGAGEKIFDVINDLPTIPTSGGLEVPQPSKGEVIVENLSFAYKTNPNQMIIENMNLEVRTGERVAIVGLSGSGKSSIISLLLRYYDTTRGRILYDGIDITRLDPQSLKKQIGVVTQDPMLFGISIRDNIAYSNPSSKFFFVLLNFLAFEFRGQR